MIRKITDTLANLVGEAVTDIRRSVVEEGWFGKPTTHETPSYYETFWARHGTPDTWRERERDRGLDNDRDIER